jgi:sec-independent protein translocase protein TatC
MSGPQREMGIWDHIGELRGRLLKIVVALALTTIASFMFAQRLIEILAVPINGLESLTAIEVTENVSVFMRVSLLSGFIFAFPFIFYQLLAFIMPGLYPNERRGVLLFIPFATLLFLGGVAFAYFAMMPTAIPFLTTFIGGVKTYPRISNYIDFVTNMMFWIGISFEVPLVVFILAKFNFVTSDMLIKNWRFAIVIIAVVAAVVTPTPDPVNMAILMTPLFGLYLLSILLAKIARPKEDLEETLQE